MAYDKFRQEATYEIPEAQPERGMFPHAFSAAMSQDFQRERMGNAAIEAEKDAERKKMLTYKVGDEKFKFDVDRNNAEKYIQSAVEKVKAGINPIDDNQKLKEESDLSQIQYDRLNSQVQDIKSKTEEGFVPKPNYIAEYSLKNNQSDVYNRNKIQDEHDYLKTNNPSKVFDVNQTWNLGIANEKNFPVTDYSRDATVQSGNAIYKTGTVQKSKFFVPSSEMEKDAQGNPILVDGKPMYRPKPVTNIEEAKSLVPQLVGSGKISREYVNLEADDIYSNPEKRKEIDDRVAEFANTKDPSLGTKPDENAVKVFRDGLKQKYAEDKIAERILSEQKAYERLSSIETGKTFKEPSKSQMEASRRRTGGAGSDAEQIVTARTQSRVFETESQAGGQKIGKIKTVVPITFKIKNNKGELVGKNATIDPSTKTAYSNSTGKEIQHIPEVGTYTGSHFMVVKTDKNGKESIDVTASKNPIERIRKLKELGYDVKVSPFESYLTFSSKNPYKDEKDKKEYAELLRLSKMGSDLFGDDKAKLDELQAKFAKNADEIFLPTDKSNASKYNETNEDLLYRTKDKNAISLYEKMIQATKEPVSKKQQPQQVKTKTEIKFKGVPEGGF